jgi:hypothetical protein
MRRMKPKKRLTTKLFIEMIANDYQFDKLHDNYSGYLNIDPQDGTGPEGQHYASIATQIAMNPDQFESKFNEHGLSIQCAHESELIIEELD